MNIYIDGLFYRGSGIGRYYESFSKEFARRGIKIYTTVPEKYRGNFEKDFVDVIDSIEPIFVGYDKYSVKGMIKQSKIVRELESKVDLFFYPHVNLPIYIPKHLIVTIHDLIPLTPFWNRNELKRFVMKNFYYKRAVDYSKGIVSISKTAEENLLKIYPKAKGKTRVIYEFVNDKFTKDVDLPRIVEKPYILFIGNRKKHKNIGNLIRAFNLIKERIPHYLVIAGAKERDFDEIDELKKELGLSDNIIELVSPDDKTILSLYKYADLFVFPSLFEGFGIPPLEAISMSCPVIASNIPVLREILGEKIASFDPYDINEIADKILRALSDNSYRAILLKEGQDRLQQFNKDKIINEYLNYFNEIKYTI